MVARDSGKIVLWPLYFDASLSRVKGRKVPKKYAIENPTAENIAKAAKSLGLNPELQPHASHPATSWKTDGRVLVDKKGSKSKLLLQIANRM